MRPLLFPFHGHIEDDIIFKDTEFQNPLKKWRRCLSATTQRWCIIRVIMTWHHPNLVDYNLRVGIREAQVASSSDLKTQSYCFFTTGLFAVCG